MARKCLIHHEGHKAHKGKESKIFRRSFEGIIALDQAFLEERKFLCALCGLCGSILKTVTRQEIVNRHCSTGGEMPELAEGARLEIVCSANPGTVGSNPTLSAIFSQPYSIFLYLRYDCCLT